MQLSAIRLASHNIRGMEKPGEPMSQGNDTRNAVLVFALLAVTGILFCQGAGGPDIVGKWQEVGEPEEFLEFSAGGEVSITDQDATVSGTWKMSGSQVTIEATLFGMTATMTGQVDGDTLRLEADGKTTEYRRVSP